MTSLQMAALALLVFPLNKNAEPKAPKMHFNIPVCFSEHSQCGQGYQSPHLILRILPRIDNSTAFSPTISPFPMARKHPFSHTALLATLFPAHPQTRFHRGQTDSKHFAPRHHKPAQSNYRPHSSWEHIAAWFMAAEPQGQQAPGMHREKLKPRDSKGNPKAGGLALPAHPLCLLRKLIPTIKAGAQPVFQAK